MAFNIFAISPILALTITGFIVISLGLLPSKISKGWLLSITLLGLIVSVYFTISLWNQNALAFGGMVAADNFSLVFNLIFLLGAGMSMLLALGRHEQSYLLYAEFFTVTLFATVGMMLMVASTNLLVIFLGLETLSISLYILAGIKRTEERSLEAAFKYFLLGAFASSFLL
ncbi:MAG: proton-conducting transporter membrane subunit, partial [bacterium]